MGRPLTYLLAAALVLLLAILAYRFAMGVQRGDLPAGDAPPVAGRSP
ncbi:hypothetical protein [Phenylobacterium sp.]